MIAYNPHPDAGPPLTRAIVDYLTGAGHFAGCVLCVAEPAGYIPTVYAVVNGCAVHIETQLQGGYPTDTQKQTLTRLQQAGAYVHSATDYQGFIEWFTAQFLTPPFA